MSVVTLNALNAPKKGCCGREHSSADDARDDDV